MEPKTITVDGKEFVVIPKETYDAFIDAGSPKITDEDIEATRTGYERVVFSGDYYSYNGANDIEKRFDSDDDEDIDNYNFGNYITDRRLMEDIARARALSQQMYQWQALNDSPVVLSRYDIVKWRISYNYKDRTLRVLGDLDDVIHNVVYFSSPEKAEECLAEYKDELLWYYRYFKPRLDIEAELERLKAASGVIEKSGGTQNDK